MDNTKQQNLANAISYHQMGEFEKAEFLYRKILDFSDDNHEVLHLLGILNAQIGNLTAAEIAIKKACQICTTKEIYFYNLGNVLSDGGNMDGALNAYLKAIDINSNYDNAYFATGNLYLKLNDFTNATIHFNKLTESSSAYSMAIVNLSNAYRKNNEWKKALEVYSSNEMKGIKNPLLLINKGNLLLDMKQYDDALICFDDALNFDSSNIDALCGKGIAYYKLNKIEQALFYLNKTISMNGEYVESLNAIGVIKMDFYLYDEAISYFKKCIEINSKYIDSYVNLSSACMGAKNYELALEYLNIAIAVDPYSSDVNSNLGALYLISGNVDAAENFLVGAINYNPSNLKAIFSLANLYANEKEFFKANKYYRLALNIEQDFNFLLGAYVYSKMRACDWQGYEGLVIDLMEHISRGHAVCACFPLLALIDKPEFHKSTAEIWVSNENPAKSFLGSISKDKHKHKHKNRIKIGYYSADFREHPVSYLVAELFELHDSNNFELIAFYSGPENSTVIHKRIVAAFDKFIDIRFKSDKDVAILSRNLSIDIAIDLTGITENERVGIFSFRAAPVQVSYIGYLGTSGAPYYDYILADHIIIPTESQKFYNEKIVYLPSFQVNDSKREISNRVFTRDELCLPSDGFVFCCFNNNYKIIPSTFNGWMRILNAVPGSVLFLYAENKLSEVNLKLEAEKRGIVNTRLIFGGRIDRSEYLARYRVADLFLDTFPYNAGTTASDALWTGLPVLTLMGESFASRVAASLLNAIELPELITTTQEQYEATAIELATNPVKLNAIKDKLRANRLTTALFDTPRFTKNIEAAFMQMYERYQADLLPEHIYIEYN